MAEYVFGPDDPADPEVRALLTAHLAFAHEHTPPGHVHALEPEALAAPGLAFVSLRRAGSVVAVGALRDLELGHAEIKSMRTADEHLGKGVASHLMAHVLDVARQRGYQRLSLETGSGGPFEAALRFYEKHGFEFCGPFADYGPDPFSRFMTLSLS